MVQQMPPNLRRFMPAILIGVFLLLVLPSLLKKHTSRSSAATRATQTLGAMNLIDASELAYRAAHGRFTSHLADLVTIKRGLASDLVSGVQVQLDVSSDGQTFFAQVASDVLSLVRSRNKSNPGQQQCLILKSGSGVTCTSSIG